jgi:RimJ/RimL family protein N-acetyltransferase
MSYENFIHSTFDSYKCSSPADELRTIPIQSENGLMGFLRPVTHLYWQISPEYVALICKWRQENPIGFANRFKGTWKKSKYWIEDVLLPRKDRILFFVHNLDNMPIGHLGYSNFDYENKSADIDNVVRGEILSNGIMALAMNTILTWGKNTLELKDVYLKVLSDNEHAIRFYEKLGFVEQNLIPLYRIETDGMISWVEELTNEPPEKYYVHMKLIRE